jgi:hypothetical protein
MVLSHGKTGYTVNIYITRSTYIYILYLRLGLFHF